MEPNSNPAKPAATAPRRSLPLYVQYMLVATATVLLVHLPSEVRSYLHRNSVRATSAQSGAPPATSPTTQNADVLITPVHTHRILPVVENGKREFSHRSYELYTVKRGETLVQICKRVYKRKNYFELAKYNGINSSDPIHPGKRIKLPRLYPPLTGIEAFDHAYRDYDDGNDEEAAEQFEAFLQEAPAQSPNRADALYYAARSRISTTEFDAWLNTLDPVRKDSIEGEALVEAQAHLQELLRDYPDNPHAASAMRDLAGVNLRLGAFNEAMTGYRAVGAQWPAMISKTAIDRRLCVAAMVKRLTELGDSDRQLLLDELRQTKRIEEVFRYREQLVRGLSASAFAQVARSLPSDTEVAQILRGGRMEDLPLRALGISSQNTDDAREAAIWLCDMGQYAESEALGRLVWENPATAHGRQRFTFAYLVSLLQQGQSIEALKVASEARLPDVVWVILGDVLSLQELAGIAASPPTWLEEPLIPRYVLGLRRYVALDFQGAQKVFWDILRDSPDSPISLYVRARLCELYELTRIEPADVSWTTARQRLTAVSAQETAQQQLPDGAPWQLFVPAAAQAIGVSQIPEADRNLLAKHLLRYDRIETDLWTQSPLKRAGLHVSESLSLLVRDVIATRYFHGLPQPAQRCLERARDVLRSLETDSAHSYNRWEKFNRVLTAVMADYVKERGISTPEQFDREIGPLLDVTWNLLRLRKDLGPEEDAAARWYSLGEYFYHCDPFAPPEARGQYYHAVGLLAGLADPSDEIIRSRLREGRCWVAAYCFRITDRIEPDDPRVLYNLAETHREAASLYRQEQKLWQTRILQAALDARLIDKKRYQDFVAMALPASLNRYLPRWQPFESESRAAITGYERLRDLVNKQAVVDEALIAELSNLGIEPPDLPKATRRLPPGHAPKLKMQRVHDGQLLVDDAMKNAGNLAGGLGQIDQAIAYFDEGIAVGGDQRQLLQLLRDALASRARVEAGAPGNLAPLAALLFAQYRHSDSGGREAERRLTELEANAPPQAAKPMEQADPLYSYLRLRADLAKDSLSNAPALMDAITGPDWNHPTTAYLLELWYSQARDAAAKDAMAQVLETKLSTKDLGAARFYVQLVAARLAIDRGAVAAAAANLDAAGKLTPFHNNPALAFELSRLRTVAKGDSTVELPTTTYAVDLATRYLFIGNRIVPFSPSTPTAAPQGPVQDPPAPLPAFGPAQKSS